MGAENNARTYTNEWGDLTGAALGAGIARTEMKDYDAAGYSVVNEPYTVPATPDSDGLYRVMLTQQPRQGTLVVTRTSGSVVLTQVAISATPGANDVGVDWQKAVLRFPASAAGSVGTSTYTGNGSVLLGARFNQLQKDVDVINEAADGFLTAANFLSRNPRIVHVTTGGNDTSGNGTVAYPYATLTKALDSLSGSVVVKLGPGSFVYTAGDNGGTDPFLLTPTHAIVLDGVPGQTTVTISGSSEGAGVHSVLVISGARGVIFDRTGTATRVTICGLEQQFGLVDCEVKNTDTEGMRVYGRTNESAPLVRYKQGTLTGDVYLANVWIKDSIVSTNKLVMDSGLGTANRGYVNRVSDSILSIATSGTFDCDLASAANVYISAPSVSVFSLAIVSDDAEAVYTEVSGKVGGTFSSGSGLISYNAAGANASVLIDRLQLRYTGTFAEAADGGKVAVFTRFQGAEPIVIRDSWIESTGICVFNSHPNPVIDSGRTSENRPLDIINSTLTTVRAATAGPEDNHAPFLNYGAGNVRSIGNRYVGTLAASTKTDTHYAGIYCSTEDLAANCVFLSKDDRFEMTFPAGTITVSGSANTTKAVYIFNDGDDDMLAATNVNPTNSVDGNQGSIFSGLGSTKVIVAGVVSCNVAVTFQNAPNGAYQVIRGDLAISGALAVAGNATVTGALQVDGNTTLGNASGDSLTINPAAPTMPNITTGTDTHFLTLDSGNVVRKEAVGISQSIDINDAVIGGYHTLNFQNGLLVSYTYNP